MRVMAAVQLDMGTVVDTESPEMGLPIANAENKKLETEVQRKGREIAALQRQSEHLGDRVQAMGDHLKNVQQELQQTQVITCIVSMRSTTSLVRPYYRTSIISAFVYYRVFTRQGKEIWRLKLT